VVNNKEKKGEIKNIIRKRREKKKQENVGERRCEE
jgi:hypothetical protein